MIVAVHHVLGYFYSLWVIACLGSLEEFKFQKLQILMCIDMYGKCGINAVVQAEADFHAVKKKKKKERECLK